MEKHPRILAPREECHLCNDSARIIHEGLPLCVDCDILLRKRKGMTPNNSNSYKSFKQIENEYHEYWENHYKKKAEIERLKNESRRRTKHLKKNYCERCGETENLELHHKDYINDDVETLCELHHEEEHKKTNAYVDNIGDKIENEKKIRELRIAELKKNEEIKAELKAREKNCFACGIKTILLRDNIPVCRKCNLKIDKIDTTNGYKNKMKLKINTLEI